MLPRTTLEPRLQGQEEAMRGGCGVIALDRGGFHWRGQAGVAAEAGGSGSHSARLNERVFRSRHHPSGLSLRAA